MTLTVGKMKGIAQDYVAPRRSSALVACEATLYNRVVGATRGRSCSCCIRTIEDTIWWLQVCIVTLRQALVPVAAGPTMEPLSGLSGTVVDYSTLLGPKMSQAVLRGWGGGNATLLPDPLAFEVVDMEGVKC